MKPNRGESQALPTVAVVGGGASGTLVAMRLLESVPVRSGRLRVLLIERRSLVGRGVAYGTDAPFHLLNVRQNRMSAYAENSEHFARFIARCHSAEMKNAFQPRSRYAEYLAASLSEVKRSAPAGALTVLTGEVMRFDRAADGMIQLTFADGKKRTCERLVVATGHRSPGIPEGLRAVRGSARFIADPWMLGAGKPIGEGETVLIVGSGLTTVDFALTRMRGAHRGTIDVISRHGLSPLAHPLKTADQSLDFPWGDETPLGILRELRKAAKAAGDLWPDVVDAFRPEVHRIWRGWSEAEKARFLRHGRAYWETHRHRVAPEVHREWDLYLRAGKVRVEAGRVLSAEEGRDGFRVTLSKRTGEIVAKQYDRIVNCTGAVPDLSLFVGHDYASDPLGVGIPTDDAGRPLTKAGAPDAAVFILGPALRTRFWEMTAVPDLRVQAKSLVDALLTGWEKSS